MGDDQIEFPEHREIRERLMHQVSSSFTNPENCHRHQLTVVSAPVAPVSGTKPAPLEELKKAAIIDSKFKPKLPLLDFKKNPLKYANVFITKAAHPREIYLRIEDEDVPRYHKMLEDLREEFRTATRHSESYCPLPILGTLLTAYSL